MLTGFKFARAAYVMFAVAVLLALLKLDGLGAHPLFLRIVPTESIAKAAEPVAGGVLRKARRWTCQTQTTPPLGPSDAC